MAAPHTHMAGTRHRCTTASGRAAAAPWARWHSGRARGETRAYILIDYISGQVLAERNADSALEPASLTKLMTCYVVFHALKAGTLKLDDRSRSASTPGAPKARAPSSRSAARCRPKCSIKGMIVQSGNDATIALAERVGGTEAAFVQLMNEYARRLGMTNTHFDDSSGLPSAHALHHRARPVALATRAGARFPGVLPVVLDHGIHLEQHQAAESQRPAGA